MTTGFAQVVTLGALSCSTLAQQTTSSSPQPPATVTVAGCVQPSGLSRPSETGPPDDGAAPGQANDGGRVEPRVLFVLADARPVGPSGAVGTSGLAITRHADGTVVHEDPRRAPRTYVLIGSGEALAPFTGRRVEVDGTVAPPASQHDPRERLTVVRVRQVADRCDSSTHRVR
jgi:hypothetical protein